MLDGILDVAVISIHAPREGRDGYADSVVSIRLHISIHAPREGRDQTFFDALNQGQQFQSTRPARGATAKPELADAAHFAFQSTRPARGAT